VTFECDARADVFCIGMENFPGPGGAAYQAAMRAGWKESPTNFLWCPVCSGKKKT
jgi:hypothetical protein